MQARSWRRRAARAAPWVAALLLAAPAAPAEDGAHNERAALTFGPTRAVLILIPGEEAAQSLAFNPPPGIDAGSEPEAELLRDCVNGESEHQLTTRGFILSAGEKAWRVLLHPLAVAVHDELLKYGTVSRAAASGNYYRGGNSRSPAALVGRISCVRFVRYQQTTADDAPVALDFVASVHLDPSHDAIRLRPLRLYIAQAGAKSANGRYSVAISVRADAVWRDEFSGHQGVVFEQTVATETVDLKAGPYLTYYPPDAPGIRVPVFPTSFGIDRSRDFGQAEFSVSVAELGTTPATLKLLSEMLPDPDEKAGQLLISAALSGSGAK
jgi:hypothetical protein